MKRMHCLLPLAAMLLLTACTSIRVRKVKDGSEPGIRYALPTTLIEVRPSEDGRYTVSEHFIADHANTYAVDARTTMGQYTLTVDVEKGLLRKVAAGRDDASLPAKALASTGSAATDYLAGRVKHQAEAEKALRSAEDAVHRAALELKQAQASLAAAEQKPDNEEALAEAQLAVVLAQLELDAANEMLATQRSRAEACAGVLNEPTGEGVWSPAYYVLVDTYDVFTGTGEVKLVPISAWGAQPGPQIRLRAIETLAGASPAPDAITLLSGKRWQAAPFKGGRVTLKTRFSAPIGNVDADAIAFTRVADGRRIEGAVEYLLGPKKQEIMLTLLEKPTAEGALQPGDYLLQIPFTRAESSQSEEVSLTVVVPHD